MNLQRSVLIVCVFLSSIIFYYIARGIIGLFIPHINTGTLDQLVFIIRLYQWLGYAIVASVLFILILYLPPIRSLIPKKKHRAMMALMVFLETTIFSFFILPAKVLDIKIIPLPPQATSVRYHYDAGISDSNDITLVFFKRNSSLEDTLHFYRDVLVGDLTIKNGGIVDAVHVKSDSRKRKFQLFAEGSPNESRMTFVRSFESEKF